MSKNPRAQYQIEVLDKKVYHAGPKMPLEVGMMFCESGVTGTREKRASAKHIAEFFRMTKGSLREALVPSKVFRYIDWCRERMMTPSAMRKRINTLKGFSRWLSLRNDWPDTLSAVRTSDFKLNKRSFYRRFLTKEEWKWLKDSLSLPQDYVEKVTGLSKSDRLWNDPQQRLLVYTTAIQTGYRRGELLSLRCSDLVIDSPESCYLRLDRSSTKNGDNATQYIQYDLACQLKLSTAGRPADSPLFPSLTLNCTEMFHEDLFRARMLWQASGAPADKDFLVPIDSRNRRLQFHSLRHTCGAWLAMSGENIKDVQEVMRHSDIRLTLDQYDHLIPGRSRRAVLKGFAGM